MESTMPPDVPEFRRACDTIVRFVHAHNGLTKDEREVVMNVVRSLDQDMTKAQAAELQVKWKQQDPPRLCEHPIQELSRSCLRDDGHLLRTYHCRVCGDASVHTLRF
jgi:hypothetical protein